MDNGSLGLDSNSELIFVSNLAIKQSKIGLKNIT